MLISLQPFIEPGQPFLNLFPPRYFAIAIPVFLGVLLFSATLITLGSFLIQSQLTKYGDLVCVIHAL